MSVCSQCSANLHHKVLYDLHVDQRQNIYELTGDNARTIQEQAASIACFVRQRNLTQALSIASHVPTLSNWIRQVYRIPFGENERFINEKALGYGTGFLITKNVVLTAAHVVCVNNSNKLDSSRIAETKIVFGFCMENPDHCRAFREDDIYKIKQVVAHAYSRTEWQDWALVKLDRNVTGRAALPLNAEKIQIDLELYMLGHPCGMPLKFTGDARIINTREPGYFDCNLDAFAGNSGSPVFRTDTKQVIGILCEGATDYVFDSNYQGTGHERCVVNRVDPSQTATHEKCQRISELTFVNNYQRQWSIGFKLKTLQIELRYKGLYVLAKCQNSSCANLNKSTWMYQGLKVFHLEDLMYQSSCTACKKDQVEVVDVGVYKSQFELEGELAEPKKMRIYKKSSAKEMKSLDQGDSFIWNYLKITVY